MGPTLARRHEDRRRSRALDGVIYFLALAIIAIGALGVHDMVFKATGVAGQERSAAQQVGDALGPPFPGRTRVRILLMGADRRPARGDKGRSDTLMVLTVNPQTQKAAVLGIPRDLKIEIPGHGTDKINAAYNSDAYSDGGVELVRSTVESLLGEKIDFYGLAYFRGFVNAVDRLGGVWVDVPDIERQGRGMNYDEWCVVNRTCFDNDDHLHVHLKPGFQKLDGAGALGFVRYRKSTMYGDGHGNWAGDSDSARSGRQQQFLKAMAQQHLRVTELHKLLMAASDLRAFVETDLSWNDVYDLLRVLKQMDPDDLWTGTVPGDDDPNFWHGGLYYWLLREDDFRDMKEEIEQHLDGLEPKSAPVEVLNASGLTGRATDAAQRLATKGLSISSCGNAKTQDAEETRIEYASGYRATARLVQSVLACGTLERMGKETASDEPAQSTPSDVGVRVLLGSDFDPQKAAVATGQAPPTQGVTATQEANGPAH
jgi:polyisoprenyl-teichoic acid--peptidoglycan teichoic acid transferase